jgi:thiol-disulfide isomerase/thioredoxin
VPVSAERPASRRNALFVLAGVVGLITAAQWAYRWVGPQNDRRAQDAGGADGLRIHPTPRPLPDLRFADGKGTPTSLAAFRGKVVLLNVWATWCPPCRKEMPTLDRLQATLGGPDFAVVALSIDQGDTSVVQAFFAQTGSTRLHPYVDTFGEATGSLGSGGIPLTLLIDRDGREIGRKLGPAEWDHPQMVELIRGYLSAAATP